MTTEDDRTAMLKHIRNVSAMNRSAQLGMTMRSHLLTERLVRKTQDGTLGQPTDELEDKELEGMEVRVGDQTTHNYYQPQSSESGSKLSSKLTPLLLAGLLGAGGAGVGATAAAYFMSSKDAPSTPVVKPGDATPSTSPDSDTQYELRLSSGEPGK